MAYRITEKKIETFATRKEEYNLSLLKFLESLRVGEALMYLSCSILVFIVNGAILQFFTSTFYRPGGIYITFSLQV